MSFDVNKIIMESLQENIEKGNGETDMGVKEELNKALNESSSGDPMEDVSDHKKDVDRVIKGGKELAGEAKEKAEELAKKGGRVARDAGKAIKRKAEDLDTPGPDRGSLATKAKRAAEDAGTAAKDFDEDHPWAKYAAGSALAAGLGAVALRKRLSKLKK
jgi:ElaB/YqjD/DUF883 family membrane-anchored ribosome-binding protein